MKRLLQVGAFVCLSLCAQAQNWTTVSASNITDLNQQKLAAGNLCFLITDQTDTPMSVMVGGGGQSLQRPYCSPVANGVVTSFTVPNPSTTAPANICYRVTATDSSSGQTVLRYSCVQFTGTTFNFDAYVPGFNLPLGASAAILTVGSLTVTGSCSGCGVGGGGGYSTIQNAGTALAQRATANFFSGITCADDSGSTRTDCQVDQGFSPTWTSAHIFNGSVNLAGGFKINGAAAAGKIPIGDGTNFVPGDPLVQGLNAEGSTVANNPVNVGGFDNAGTPAIHGTKVLSSAPAGTEYGIVTRPIPSGTQTVSGTVTANAGTGTFNIQANASVNQTQVAGTGIDVNSGNKSAGTQRIVIATDQPQLTNALKVDGSAVTQPVSGTVTANIGTSGSLALDATLTGGSLKAHGNVASAASDSGNPVKIGGVFNTTQPTVTTGQRVDVQMSNRGEQFIAKGVSGFSIDNTGFNVNNTPAVTQSGTWTVQPGNTANTTPWLTTDSADGSTGSAVPTRAGFLGVKDTSGNLQGMAGDTNGRQFIKQYPDTTTTSYRASKKFAASSTTDNAVMPGNATNTVLVTKILVTCNQTTAGQINVELLKRSTADTVGTSAAMTVVPMDSNYAAAVSAPLSYTGTGPTVGTAVGDLDNLQIGCMAPATATPNDIFIFHPDKPIILRGTAQQIAVNVANAALTGGNVTVTFEWMETTTP